MQTSSTASFSDVLDRYIEHVVSPSVCARLDSGGNGLRRGVLTTPNHEHKMANDRSAKKRRKDVSDELLDRIAARLVEQVSLLWQLQRVGIDSKLLLVAT